MRFVFVVLCGCMAVAGTGCVTSDEMQAIQAELIAVEREQRQRSVALGRRLDAVETNIATPATEQAELRRGLAKAVASHDELRLDVQRLRGDVQELQHRLQSGAGPNAEIRDIVVTKMAEMETRLTALESHLGPSGGQVFVPPSARAPEPGSSGTVSPSESPTPVKSPGATRPVTPTPTTHTPRVTRPVTTQPAKPVQGRTTADELYKKALGEHQEGQYEVAIVLFKQFLRRYGTHPLAGHSQYWIGESLYKSNQYEAAIAAFDKVVQTYPQDTKVPASELKQGLAFAKLKEKKNARFFLEQVQKKYPNSPEARQASAKLKELR